MFVVINTRVYDASKRESKVVTLISTEHKGDIEHYWCIPIKHDIETMLV